MPDSVPTDQKPLVEQIARFPDSPGVYIMKNGDGVPIYIGKAVNLKSRVRSYFSDSHEERPQIPIMLQQLASIDWIATTNEAEALILEANLIRRHLPRYNIDLRDDKHFPYLKVTTGEPFPRLLVVRRVEKDGGRYFGPYTDPAAMRRLADFARRIFKLCDSTQPLPATPKKTRPCLNYSMHRCSGACVGAITPDAYRVRINDLTSFLSGKRNALLAGLESRMAEASAGLRFEEAAGFRDQIRLIRDAGRLQQVDLKIPDECCDAIGSAEGNRSCCLAVLSFREGLLVSIRRFLFDRKAWELSRQERDDLVVRFYLEEGRETPPELLLPPDQGFDPAALQQWFDGLLVKTVVQIPQKGIRRGIVLMAEKNARLYLSQKAAPSGEQACAELQRVLKLGRFPEIIEGFDISNLGTSFCVAAMVRFVNGMPEKGGYRRYKIKTVRGQNDFAMMLEAVSRRFSRLQSEHARFPDLVLIDGGPGQLHAAMEALAPFPEPPAIAALAKKEELLHAPTVPGPVRLGPAHPARRLVERIRDEAHRFAVSYHRNIRGKQFQKSELEDIPGIGKAKAQLLLRKFGSLERIKKASPEKITEVKGFSIKLAGKINQALEGK